MILTSTSIRIHPKAMHPYPLYIHFIAFLASCSNLASSNPSEKVPLTLGPWATAAPVSLAATRRWAWQMMANVSFIGCAENALAMTCDRGFRCKTSCLQQRQMIYKKCLKLVGRKWFSFRRLLMAGRSTVFSQTNAPLHSVFSCIDTILAHFHVWWHAKHTKWYCVNAFVLHLIPFVTLCWPLYKPYQAFLGLPLGEARGFPIWPFKSLIFHRFS